MGQTTLSIIGSIIVLVGGWYLNERSKRRHEEYKRKEERYLGLIRSISGFYVDSFSRELRTEFLNQRDICWMYCPDDIIRKANNFLSMVHTDQKHSDEEKEKSVQELILAIRKDLVRKTKLKLGDFKLLTST